MAIEFGVRWTPNTRRLRVETSPLDEEGAVRLAWQLRDGQMLCGDIIDAVVVYRARGGKWTTSRFAARAQQLLGWFRRPPRLPTGADRQVQQLLDEIQAHPDGPNRALADRYHDNGTTL